MLVVELFFHVSVIEDSSQYLSLRFEDLSQNLASNVNSLEVESQYPHQLEQDHQDSPFFTIL